MYVKHIYKRICTHICIHIHIYKNILMNTDACKHIRIYIYIYTHHHHHHITSPARIFPTFSRHPSLSSIASGRSSRQYPVSAQNC